MTSAPGRNTPVFEDTCGASVSENLRSRAPVIQQGKMAVAHGPTAPGAALAPTLGKMAAIRVPSHRTGENVLGACGASGLCSRSGRGTHGRAPAAGSAVFAPGCTRDRRRSRRNQGVAPHNSLTLKLIEQFSWVRALAKYPPTLRRRTWRLHARSREIGAAPNTALPARGLHGDLPLRGVPTALPKWASLPTEGGGVHKNAGCCAKSEAVWPLAANASPLGARPARSRAN